jgi:hypothetical protein
LSEYRKAYEKWSSTSVQLLFRFRKLREEAMPWPRQRLESITSDWNVSWDCVPVGLLEHVRRLRNAEYHGLDNAIALVSEAPGFWKQRRSLGFPEMASSSTTVSNSVLDTKASSTATEFLDGLPLEERRQGPLEWPLGN